MAGNTSTVSIAGDPDPSVKTMWLFYLSKFPPDVLTPGIVKAMELAFYTAMCLGMCEIVKALADDADGEGEFIGRIKSLLCETTDYMGN